MINTGWYLHDGEECACVTWQVEELNMKLTRVHYPVTCWN